MDDCFLSRIDDYFLLSCIDDCFLLSRIDDCKSLRLEASSCCFWANHSLLGRYYCTCLLNKGKQKCK
ncbi:Protein of unknown function [Pyronema omphalodes CBS 100304]|uniref:Uncharacterized protein n=1 Tax=Pyronema omphalodes (strain CBS 100304) TaxID=1076935 RepID=U4L7U1_PYROM|nr:Protein of unknown function [Pyronema omphalodes CBS 100304]